MAGSCSDACLRCCCAQETFFRVKYGNKTGQQLYVGLTPNFPAKVVPINMSEVGGALTIKNRAFLASLNMVPTFAYRFAGSIGAACCGGQGLILNEVQGDGTVFLNASGTILMRRLQPGERLVSDQSSVVAFSSTCQFDIKRSGGLGMLCCGGEGLFNTVLTGPGTVVLQSMPVEKIALALWKAMQPGRNPGAGNGL
jgi:uncharacterized protein (AIM24 family)